MESANEDPSPSPDAPDSPTPVPFETKAIAEYMAALQALNPDGPLLLSPYASNDFYRWFTAASPPTPSPTPAWVTAFPLPAASPPATPSFADDSEAFSTPPTFSNPYANTAFAGSPPLGAFSTIPLTTADDTPDADDSPETPFQTESVAEYLAALQAIRAGTSYIAPPYPAPAYPSDIPPITDTFSSLYNPDSITAYPSNPPFKPFAFRGFDERDFGPDPFANPATGQTNDQNNTVPAPPPRQMTWQEENDSRLALRDKSYILPVYPNGGADTDRYDRIESTDLPEYLLGGVAGLAKSGVRLALSRLGAGLGGALEGKLAESGLKTGFGTLAESGEEAALKNTVSQAEKAGLRTSFGVLPQMEEPALVRNMVAQAEKFVTHPNEAVFWSELGEDGAEIADRFAADNGGKTLDMVASENGVKFPPYVGSDPASVAAWDRASELFAQKASGDVRVLLGHDFRQESTWRRVEFPALRSNPKVRSITAINPKTGTQLILFQRR